MRGAGRADNEHMEQLVAECLRCGQQRPLVRGRRRCEAGECPRCRYVGWADTRELSEETRGRYRERPLEARLRLCLPAPGR